MPLQHTSYFFKQFNIMESKEGRCDRVRVFFDKWDVKQFNATKEHIFIGKFDSLSIPFSISHKKQIKIQTKISLI